MRYVKTLKESNLKVPRDGDRGGGQSGGGNLNPILYQTSTAAMYTAIFFSQLRNYHIKMKKSSYSQCTS